MPFATWLSSFLILTLIAYTPGPMTMFSMSSSVRNGFLRTLPAIAGGSSAYITQMAIVYLGLGVIVQTSAMVFGAIKWAGVIYLIVLAVRNWRKAIAPDEFEYGRSRAPLSRQFLLGYATGMSNPKSILVFTVLFPQFIDPSRYTEHFCILAATFFVVQGSSAVSYALFGARVFHWLRRKCLSHLQNKATALILLCAAGVLATSEK